MVYLSRYTEAGVVHERFLPHTFLSCGTAAQVGSGLPRLIAELAGAVIKQQSVILLLSTSCVILDKRQ